MSTETGKQPTEVRKSNGRNPFLILGGFLLLGMALALVLFGGSLWGGDQDSILQQIPSLRDSAGSASVSSSANEPLAIGDVAYDFTLQDLDGNSHQLSDFEGRPIILNFWATWCAPCRIEMPELQAAYEEYKEEGLVILAIDQQEPPDIVREFFYGELGLTFTPLLDGEGTIADLYGTNRVYPTTYFVNGEGLVTAVHRGPMVRSQIDEYLVNTIPSS